MPAKAKIAWTEQWENCLLQLFTIATSAAKFSQVSNSLDIVSDNTWSCPPGEKSFHRLSLIISARHFRDSLLLPHSCLCLANCPLIVHWGSSHYLTSDNGVANWQRLRSGDFEISFTPAQRSIYGRAELGIGRLKRQFDWPINILRLIKFIVEKSAMYLIDYQFC